MTRIIAVLYSSVTCPLQCTAGVDSLFGDVIKLCLLLVNILIYRQYIMEHDMEQLNL